jgi:very-short-patch-repair endonuclease
LPVGNGHHRLLDFFIKSKNKCLEFDGDYWHHSEDKKMPHWWDSYRDEQIKNQGVSILHIRESDYNNSKEKVIDDCLRFIYE